MRCPRDRAELVAETRDGSRVDRCPRCRGVAVTIALLRRIVPQQRLRAFWQNLPAGSPGDLCPSCANRLIVVPFDCHDRTLELDACIRCQTMWFDADELRHFSPERQSPDRRHADVSAAAAEALAIAQLDTTPAGGESRATSIALGIAADVLSEIVFLFIL